ncbi:hypothetical protein [Acidobacterium capsulatum]
MIYLVITLLWPEKF